MWYKRRTGSDRFFEVINLSLLALVCLIIMYPIYHLLIVSISDGYAVIRGEVGLLPVGINFTAYRAVLQNPAIPRAYMNTVLYTTVGTAINLIFTTLCAYPLSRKWFYGRNVFTFLIIFTMFFDAGIISNFMVVRSLGLLDTMWAIVLPPAISSWNMIIMRTFFQTQIPDELHESAHLDGAREFTIFLKIVLPLSKPVLATMALFYAVGHWNSWFSALVYLSRSEMFPMQLIMRNIVLSGDTTAMAATVAADMGIIATNIRYAVVFITMAPILLVYPFVQRYFVKGIMIGSLKG